MRGGQQEASPANKRGPWCRPRGHRGVVKTKLDAGRAGNGGYGDRWQGGPSGLRGCACGWGVCAGINSAPLRSVRPSACERVRARPPSSLPQGALHPRGVTRVALADPQARGVPASPALR